MGETQARVDALIAKLGDVDQQVRLEAIEELGTIDKEHALPALHWAIQNEMDETVRNAARDVYQRLSQVNREVSNNEVDEGGDKTRMLSRPKVKAVVVEEGAPNPAGDLSLRISLVGIVALMVWLLVELGQAGRRGPVLIWWLRIACGISVPGLVLGIVGMATRGERHLPAIAGTVLNGLLLILFFFTVVLPLIRG
jgi:hypothetical protein